MIGIKEKMDRLQSRVEEAAKRSGRSAKDITIVAVTKGAAAEAVKEAAAAGLRIFGENKVQEAEAKIPLVGDPPLEWHMIGHLQSNKIKPAMELFGLIQSVDALSLAKKLNEAATAGARTVSVLLEVNISGEKQKFGFSSDEIYGVLEQVAALPAVKVLGLMGMAPAGPDAAVKKEAFKKLRNIFSVCRTLKHPNIEMRHLSMGMSDDFEIAIEEGSNMIRIGRALFS